MALSEPIRKGGRYTKKEQEERRFQVFQYHFVQKKSGNEIAKILKVNRNTVNHDIQYMFSKFGNNPNNFDMNGIMIKQIQRLEMNRDRYYEYLEEAQAFNEKIKAEKLIFEIDNKIIQICSKNQNENGKLIQKNNSETFDGGLREVVRKFLLPIDPYEDCVYTQRKLKTSYSMKMKCGQKEAEEFLENMKKAGLQYLENHCPVYNEFEISPTYPKRYPLDVFAYIKDYISMEEFEEIQKVKESIKKKNEDNKKI